MSFPESVRLLTTRAPASASLCAHRPRHSGLRFYPASRNAIAVPGKEKKFVTLLKMQCHNNLRFFAVRICEIAFRIAPHKPWEKSLLASP